MALFRDQTIAIGLFNLLSCKSQKMTLQRLFLYTLPWVFLKSQNISFLILCVYNLNENKKRNIGNLILITRAWFNFSFISSLSAPSRTIIFDSKTTVHSSIIMVCDSVCACVCSPEITSPAAANGPIDMIFGMALDIDDRMPIFGKSRS